MHKDYGFIKQGRPSPGRGAVFSSIAPSGNAANEYSRMTYLSLTKQKRELLHQTALHVGPLV